MDAVRPEQRRTGNTWAVEHLAARLAAIPGVVAVTLGGSRATNTAAEGSDWDFGLYYRGRLDPAEIVALGWPGRVFAPGEWGRIMNGGAWATSRTGSGNPIRTWALSSPMSGRFFA